MDVFDSKDFIPVITRKEATKVRVSEILYIETELRVINIYTISRAYRFYGKIDKLSTHLDNNFFRCHKSCIVNFAKIIQMQEGIFYFAGGITLRIGQNNYQIAKKSFNKYLVQKYG